MDCKYCGKTGFSNEKGLATHRRYSSECLELWLKEQDEIKQSKTYIRCEICGMMLRNISNTHLKKHNITQAEYKLQFPNSPIFSPGLLELQRDNREATIIEKYTNNKINIRDSNSLSHFIDLFGEEDGNIKYRDRNNRKSYTQSEQYYIEKYGEDTGKKKWEERNKKIGVTLEKYITKYGEIEGINRYDIYIQSRKYFSSKEYYITKHGEEWYKELNRRKSHTIDVYIEKYGYDIGFNRYCSYMDNRSIGSISQPARELFLSIEQILNRDTFYFAKTEYDKEYGVYLKHSKRYAFLDFYDSFTNKCIEFFGDYWHANPEIYNDDDLISYPNKRQSLAETIWIADNDRIEEIKSVRGIETMIVWELDYNNDPAGVIDKCIEFLQ